VQPVNFRFSFLIDSGSVISVLPKHFGFCTDSYSNTDTKIFAANQTEIKTYGFKTLKVNLGDRNFLWKFIIADVPRAILGADFLLKYDLLVDCKNKILIDRNNSPFINQIQMKQIPTFKPTLSYIPKTKITTFCNSMHKKYYKNQNTNNTNKTNRQNRYNTYIKSNTKLTDHKTVYNNDIKLQNYKNTNYKSNTQNITKSANSLKPFNEYTNSESKIFKHEIKPEKIKGKIFQYLEY